MNRFLTSATIVLTGTIIVSPLSAQGRVVDLTGRPAAALDEPFTAISGVREVAPGVVIISDVRERRLVRSDLANGEVRDIGRQGDGPGEWRLPMAVLPGKGKDTYIPDMMQAKIHVVSPEGAITRSVPMTPPGATGMMMVMPQSADAQGRLYYSGAPISDSGQPSDSIPVQRTDFLAAKPGVDTMAMMPNEIMMTSSATGGGARITMGRPTPYQARDSWTALPDGRVAVVRSKPYRVEIHRAGKQTVVGPTISYSPIKIGAAERNAYRERMKNATGMMITRGGSGGGGVQANTMSLGDQKIPDSDFPDAMPAFDPNNGVVVAPNGEIWVRRSSAASVAQVNYDIFSPATGARIGTAKLRANSRVVAFGVGSVYVARQDQADDLLYLERYGQ
jgi:hypothetical protein